MKTYIRNNIKGYYVEFPEEIDAEYWEGKIGTTYEDFRDGKWVLLSDEQLQFHNDNPSASISQVLTMTLPQPIERTIEDARFEKIHEIERYDNGTNINSFNVVSGDDTISAWLTPAERSNYRSSIDAAELVGLDTVSFYVNNLLITLPVLQAKVMLAQIQLYADQCYIVAKQHKYAVNSLESIEEVDNYDYTVGYPEQLTFNL